MDMFVSAIQMLSNIIENNLISIQLSAIQFAIQSPDRLVNVWYSDAVLLITMDKSNCFTLFEYWTSFFCPPMEDIWSSQISKVFLQLTLRTFGVFQCQLA